MFLSYKGLKDRGIEVNPKKDGVELIPHHHWSEEAQEWFKNFTIEINLTESEHVEVAAFVETVSMMSAIKSSIK